MSMTATARLTVARIAMVAVTLCAVAAFTPPPASAFSKAIWGEITHDGVNQFPLYKKLGVKIYETDLNWNVVAPTRPAHPTDPADPAYRWPADIQQAITLAARYHMRVLLQVIETPPWANGGHTGNGWAPTRASDYVAFARAAAREYPSVHLWMVWGEPSKADNFLPLQAVEPDQPLDKSELATVHIYAEMLDGTYGALKKASKKNLIIGGNTYTTGAVDPLQWIENLKLPNGKVPRMDMWGHNPFSYTTPQFSGPPSPFDEVQFSDLHELEGWIHKYLHEKLPLFLSEFTIPTSPDQTFNFYVDPPVAAQWVTDALTLSRKWNEIYALGWVNVYDDLPTIAGGLLTEAGVPKLDFYAFEHG